MSQENSAHETRAKRPKDLSLPELEGIAAFAGWKFSSPAQGEYLLEKDGVSVAWNRHGYGHTFVKLAGWDRWEGESKTLSGSVWDVGYSLGKNALGLPTPGLATREAFVRAVIEKVSRERVEEELRLRIVEAQAEASRISEALNERRKAFERFREGRRS